MTSAETLKAPDFPGGGLIIYDRAELEKIYAHRPGQRHASGRVYTLR